MTKTLPERSNIPTNDSEVLDLTRKELRLILEHADVKLCDHEVKKFNIRNNKHIYIQNVYSAPALRWFAIFYFVTLFLSLVFISASNNNTIAQILSLIYVVMLLFASYIIPWIIGVFFWFGFLFKTSNPVDTVCTILSYYISTLTIAIIGGWGYFSAQVTLVENIKKFHLDYLLLENTILLVFIYFTISVLSVFWFVLVLKRLLVIKHKKWMFFNPIKDFGIEILLFAFTALDLFRNTVFMFDHRLVIPLFFNAFIVLVFVVFLIFKNDKKMFDRYHEHFQGVFKYIE